MTRSAPCTRASSVPQIITFGWARTGSRTSPLFSKDLNKSRYSVAEYAPPCGASVVRSAIRACASAPAALPHKSPHPSGAVPRARASANHRWPATRSGKALQSKPAIRSSALARHSAHSTMPTSSRDFAQAIKSCPVRKLGPCLRSFNSRWRVNNKCCPRSPPVAASGCFNTVSKRSGVSFSQNNSTTCERNRPGADKASGFPAESSGKIAHRSKAAATCRVRLRSGVIKAALVPFSAASRKINAIASASLRGEAASIRVMSLVASIRSGNIGPSINH